MSKINEWRIYIRADGTIYTALNNLEPAFKGSTKQKVILVTPETTNNQRVTVKLSNGSKDYAAGLFKTGITEEVEVEPGVFEEWGISEGHIGNDILKSVKDFNATPVYVSFQEEEVEEIENPNDLNYKGAFRSVPIVTENFVEDDYIGVGIESDRNLNTTYLFVGDDFVPQDISIGAFEEENDIVIKLSIYNVAQQEVPVSASTIGVTQKANITETDTINSRLAKNESDIGNVKNVLGDDGDNVIKSDMRGNYQVVTELNLEGDDTLVFQDSDGKLKGIDAELLLSYANGNFLGVYDIPSLLPDIVNDPNRNKDTPYQARVTYEEDGITPNGNNWQWITNVGNPNGQQYSWYDTLTKGDASQAQIDALQDQLDLLEQNKSERIDTGLSNDLSQAIKDIIAGGGTPTDTSIVGSINALFPLIESGAGDMRKLEYATQEAGKVDKAIGDGDDNNITATYERKDDVTNKLGLKQDKSFGASNGALTVEDAIDLNTSNLGSTNGRIDGNDTNIAENRLDIDNNILDIQELEDTKISAISIKNSAGDLVGDDLITLVAGNNTQLTQTASGEYRMDIVPQVSGFDTITNEIDPLLVPLDIPLTAGNKIKIDMVNKKPSTNPDEIDNDINNDVVIETAQDIIISLDSEFINSNTSSNQETRVEVLVNGLLLGTLEINIGEAQPGEPISFPYTPELIYDESEILNVTAFPITITFEVYTNNTGATVSKFEYSPRISESDSVGGNVMFTDTYDADKNGKIDDGKVDFDGTGTNFVDGDVTTKEAIVSLDTNLKATAVKAQANETNITTLTDGKQDKLPGDLLTTIKTTSGAINENKGRLDVADSKIENNESNIEDLQESVDNIEGLLYEEGKLDTELINPFTLIVGVPVSRPPATKDNVKDPAILDYDELLNEYNYKVPGTNDSKIVINYTTGAPGNSRSLVVGIYDVANDGLINERTIELPKNVTDNITLTNTQFFPGTRKLYLRLEALDQNITINDITTEPQLLVDSLSFEETKNKVIAYDPEELNKEVKYPALSAMEDYNRIRGFNDLSQLNDLTDAHFDGLTQKQALDLLLTSSVSFGNSRLTLAGNLPKLRTALATPYGNNTQTLEIEIRDSNFAAKFRVYNEGTSPTPNEFALINYRTDISYDNWSLVKGEYISIEQLGLDRTTATYDDIQQALPNFTTLTLVVNSGYTQLQADRPVGFTDNDYGVEIRKFDTSHTVFTLTDKYTSAGGNTPQFYRYGRASSNLISVWNNISQSTYTQLEEINLTDAHFTGLTQVLAGDLMQANLPAGTRFKNNFGSSSEFAKAFKPLGTTGDNGGFFTFDKGLNFSNELDIEWTRYAGNTLYSYKALHKTGDFSGWKSHNNVLLENFGQLGLAVPNSTADNQAITVTDVTGFTSLKLLVGAETIELRGVIEIPTANITTAGINFFDHIQTQNNRRLACYFVSGTSMKVYYGSSRDFNGGTLFPSTSNRIFKVWGVKE